jgi:hypothetical protein
MNFLPETVRTVPRCPALMLTPMLHVAERVPTPSQRLIGGARTQKKLIGSWETCCYVTRVGVSFSAVQFSQSLLHVANYSDKPRTIHWKISISVELYKWNTKIKLEYIDKLEFDEKFGKIDVIQILTVSSCFTFLIPQGIALKAFYNY